MESTIYFLAGFQASTIAINKTINNNVLAGFVSVSDGSVVLALKLKPWVQSCEVEPAKKAGCFNSSNIILSLTVLWKRFNNQRHSNDHDKENQHFA